MSDTAGLGYVDANLNDVEAWDGEGGDPIKPGEYVVRVANVTGGQSQSGNPKMQLEYEIIEALDPENESEVGRKVLQSQSLNLSSQGTARRVKNLVTALGILDNRGGFDPQKAIGKEMLCEIRTETYDKIDPQTGATMQRETTKVLKERSLDAADAHDEEPEEEEEVKAAPKATASRGRRVTRRTSRASAN